MKKPETKADLRVDLERAIESYLRQGGQVKSIPRGISGHLPGASQPHMARRLFVEPRTKRTLVPEVVAAIEERRKSHLKRNPSPKRSRPPRTRRKVIYDDFGEPLRTVWVED